MFFAIAFILKILYNILASLKFKRHFGDIMEFLNILKKLLNQIFFNDDFSSEEVAGLFSPAHFAYIFVFVIGMAVLIKLSLGMDKRKARKVRLLIAVSVTVMEVIKIALRIYKGQHISSWIPLYYCSLFIFAVWLSLIPSESISRIGKSYIAMGGAMAALIFTIVPTTSIAIFPALHIATVHSFIYHFLMFYSGIMLFIQEGYKPRLSDGVRYFLFISSLKQFPKSMYIMRSTYQINIMSPHLP